MWRTKKVLVTVLGFSATLALGSPAASQGLSDY